MTTSKNTIFIDLGKGEQGQRRRAALMEMAREHRQMWNDKPSIGRLIKRLADKHINRQWWHWAVQSDAGCWAIYDAGVKVNIARPARGVREGSITDNDRISGHWRTQPICDPGERPNVWSGEINEMRDRLGESSGVFYVEFVNYNKDTPWGSGFDHTAQNGVLIAVSSDGDRAAWKRVL